jgi:class 3 adenylate cyclase
MPGGQRNGPDDEHAGLVEYLRSVGIADDDIAANEGVLLSLASRRVLFGDEPRMTVDEVADAAGCDAELVRRVRLAAGLPDPGAAPACSRLEVVVMQSFLLGVDAIGENETLQFTRVLGNATAGLAEAALATFASNRQASLVEEGESLAGIARAGAEATVALLSVAPVLDVLLRLHFEAASTGRFSSQEPAPRMSLLVAFVDLVESTRLTLALPERELSAALSDFERDASDVVVASGGRVVKRIGDAVMFVASDAAQACRAATTILDRVAAHPQLHAARAAVAAGDVLPRDGDYFGAPVNLAARAVPIAEPGAIVVTREVRDALPAHDWHVVDLGAHSLKGFDDPVELFAISPTS